MQVYLDLDRKPAASASNAGENDAATAALSPEELKKQKQRRRKVRAPLEPHLALGCLALQRPRRLRVYAVSQGRLGWCGGAALAAIVGKVAA